MKKSRKKMLLSSIAMLLVALIALGSATFAWYFVNNSVTASTTKFSATSASGLVIRHVDSADESTWTNKITDLLQKYEDATSTPKQAGLTPASITYSGLSALRGGSANSGAWNSSTISGEPSYQQVKNGQFFLVDTFYVASASAKEETATMKATCSAADTTKYLNLAIYVGDTLTKVITWDSENDGTVGKFENDTAEDSIKVSATTYSGVVKAANEVQISTTVPCPPKGGLGSGTKITVIGFADGFNSKCKSDSVDTSFATATFTFSV